MTILSSSLRWFLFASLSFSASLAALDLSLDVDKLGIVKPVNSGPGYVMFSRHEKKNIHREFVRQLRATGKVVNNSVINAYIQSLGQEIARQSSAAAGIEFLVINDRSVNAFAGLGGVIAVHTGMILQSQTEAELASVLAHEVAHISQKHIERSIEASKSAGALITQALLMALAIVAGDKNPQVSQAAITVATGLQIQRGITHTRLHEMEADAVGIKILSRAGYDAKSMEAMFEGLSKSQRFSSSRIPSFLLTHPLTTDRIAKMSTLSKGLKRGSLGNRADFIAIKQMIKLEAGQRGTQQDLRTPAGKVVQALRLLRSGKLSRANTLVQQVIKNPGASVYVKLLLGQYFAEIKQLAKSMAWNKKAYKQKPSVSVLRLVESLLRAGHLKQAKVVLDKATKLNLFEAKKLMAALYARQGKMALSYYWQAEYAYISGYTKRAIGHLIRAKKISQPGFYLDSKIEARLKEYKRISALES